MAKNRSIELMPIILPVNDRLWEYLINFRKLFFCGKIIPKNIPAIIFRIMCIFAVF
jgi:hypothetical protein